MSIQAQETKDQIKAKLKSLLKKGAITRVAKKHDVSTVYVSYIISGKHEDADILESLYEEALAYKNIQQKILSL